MTVVGAVDDQGMLQSPGLSSFTEKKKKPNPTEKSKGHTSKHSRTGSEKPAKSPTSKSHRSSADARIDELDQKWSGRFNRLEALLAKTLDKPEETFTTVTTVFVSVANITQALRDSYLSHLKAGIKPDTLAALRTAPLHIPTLFPDEAQVSPDKAQVSPDDIANFESKGQLHPGKKGRFHPYERPNGQITGNQTDQPGRILVIVDRTRRPRAKPRITLQDQPRPGREREFNTKTDNKNFHVVKVAHTAPGHSQKKEISPGSAGCYSQKEYGLTLNQLTKAPFEPIKEASLKHDLQDSFPLGPWVGQV